MSIPSTNHLAPPLREQLMEVAWDSIRHGVHHQSPSRIDPHDYPEALRVERACFVTLNRNGLLRGCIGHLEAYQPLVVDVAENAYAAAFRDPRFPPLTEAELHHLDIHISILTPSEPMHFTSEEDLLHQIRPGIDGLILVDGRHRGTFLPSVWESLPDPRDFLLHLKQKAGLPHDYWSDSLEVMRYETESFPETADAH
ncbi:MAG: AmmeMemoRadiSam system protein A [Candidatus Thiodiazotropha sp.]